MNKMDTPAKTPSIYVISGGVGASGEQLVRTAVAQFQEMDVSVQVFPKVFTKKQAKLIVQAAADEDAIVAHTFVNAEIREVVSSYAQKLNVVEIDLIGSLMERLSHIFQKEPIGKPGLYRLLYKSYFDRIDAMDFTFSHDDGQNPQGWGNAEFVLLGPSRVGKTPLSLYLSILGWKVANVPLVPGIPPPSTLFELDKRRMVGLTIDPSTLVQHRVHRQRRLGVVGESKPAYVDPVKVFEETEAIESMLRKEGIPIIDVTEKPIETSAAEIVRLVTRKVMKSSASAYP